MRGEPLNDYDLDRIASRFVTSAICEWGQQGKERIDAVQQVLDAALFDAEAICWPIFGGIWPKQCEGPDAKAASEWLKDLTATMRRGKFEWERDHVIKAIQARRRK